MVSSIYGYSTTGAAGTRRGWTGLVSGMDTDEIIKNLMSASNARLDKLYQKQQKLDWKTEAYRSVTSSVMNFSNKYLSSSSSSSPFSSAFFENATITALGANASAVSVTGSVTNVSKLQINSVSSLATTASFTTKMSASQHAVYSGTISESSFENGKNYSTLEGSSLNFQINGTRYDVTLENVQVDTTDPTKNAQNIVDALNEGLKKAGISDKLSASLSSNGAVQFTAASGAGTVELIGGGNAALNNLGLKTGTSVKAGATLTGTQQLTDSQNMKNLYATSTLEGMAGKSITFDLNGVKKTITFDEDMAAALENESGSTNLEKLASYVNKKMADAFGTYKDGSLAGQQKVSVSAENGKLKFTTSDDSSILSLASGNSAVSGASGFLGIEVGAANRLLRYEPITESNLNVSDAVKSDLAAGGTQDIVVNGTTFTVGMNSISVTDKNGKTSTYDFSAGVTTADITDTINNAQVGVKIAYNSTSDSFTVTATESGSFGEIDISGGELAQAMFGTASDDGGSSDTREVVKGQDAVLNVSLDGGKTSIDVIRSSNSFSLDNMQISLNSTFSGEAVTFSGKSNVDDIVKGITDMVDAYNTMMRELNSQVSTKPDSDYEPLTSSQKEEMSESQIELWENKAKAGSLYGDTLVSSLARELRFAFTMPSNGKSMSDIGISTVSYLEDTEGSKIGVLKVDETKLRQVLEEDPELVQQLFGASSGSTVGAMDTTAGVATRLKSVADKYVSTTGTKGLLINKAGHESSPLSLTDNAMYRESKTLSDQISRFLESMQTEEDRYYDQFSSLEVYINQMNTQSSWLTSQFSSY